MYHITSDLPIVLTIHCYRDLKADFQRLKTDNNALTLKTTELQGLCSEYKDKLHAMEMEINSLAHKYDVSGQGACGDWKT